MVPTSPLASFFGAVDATFDAAICAGVARTTTTFTVVAVTPRDVAPPLFFGAGATQNGPPGGGDRSASSVTNGNTPKPLTASALHFGFSSAAFVPMPTPGGAVPIPLVFTGIASLPLAVVCAPAGANVAESSATVTLAPTHAHIRRRIAVPPGSLRRCDVVAHRGCSPRLHPPVAAGYPQLRHPVR